MKGKKKGGCKVGGGDGREGRSVGGVWRGKGERGENGGKQAVRKVLRKIGRMERSWIIKKQGGLATLFEYLRLGKIKS